MTQQNRFFTEQQVQAEQNRILVTLRQQVATALAQVEQDINATLVTAGVAGEAKKFLAEYHNDVDSMLKFVIAGLNGHAGDFMGSRPNFAAIVTGINRHNLGADFKNNIKCAEALRSMSDAVKSQQSFGKVISSVKAIALENATVLGTLTGFLKVIRETLKRVVGLKRYDLTEDQALLKTHVAGVKLNTSSMFGALEQRRTVQAITTLVTANPPAIAAR